MCQTRRRCTEAEQSLQALLESTWPNQPKGTRRDTCPFIALPYAPATRKLPAGMLLHLRNPPGACLADGRPYTCQQQ